MGRIQGLTELYLGGQDVLVKSGAGELFSITITFNNTAVGSYIVIRDGTDGEASPLVKFIMPVIGVGNASYGTMFREWANGKRFENGLYFDFQNNDAIECEITYK